MKPLVASIITPLLLFIARHRFRNRNAAHRPADAATTKARPRSLRLPSSTTSATRRAVTSTLVSADQRDPHPRRQADRIDDLTWSQWAFCETGPVQMIYKLHDGAVTVTVKLDKSTPHRTLATVAADFQGRYELGGNENTVACTSRFVLEDNILAAAGAAPGK